MDSTEARFRIMGWDPFVPGSAVWLAADEFSTTRNASRALLVTGYTNADRLAIDASRRTIASLSRWRAVAEATDDLADLQSHVRHGRAPLGAIPGTPTPAQPSPIPRYRR